jgi:hypothetical protein
MGRTPNILPAMTDGHATGNPGLNGDTQREISNSAKPDNLMRLGATGSETLKKPRKNIPLDFSSGAESGAVTHFPPDLARLILLWPMLTSASRSAILTLASASVPHDAK